MAYLVPVDQVLAFEERYAGEEGERRIDQIERVADATDGGVWIETGQHGIQILAAVVVLLLETGVSTCIGKREKRSCRLGISRQSCRHSKYDS